MPSGKDWNSNRSKKGKTAENFFIANFLSKLNASEICQGSRFNLSSLGATIFQLRAMYLELGEKYMTFVYS